MVTRQINQVLMFTRVEDYCEKPDYQTIIRSVESLSEDYDHFRTCMAPLRKESEVALTLRKAHGARHSARRLS